MHPAFAVTSHRPWPVPDRAWALAMTWHDLLFAHWRVPAAALRPLVPRALEIDTFDGAAWIGVVPFRMTGVRLRAAPPIPGTGAFVELNVRTYVTDGDRPGVWFLSLDAESGLAVRAARRWFDLPYFDAEMACEAAGNDLVYRSRRTHRGAPAAEFSAWYGPAGAVFRAAPGSLDEFLVERYCLYAARPDGTLRRGEVQHAPWPLQRAHAEIDANTMAAAAGVELPQSPPHLLFARQLETVAWAPERSGG